MKILELTDAYNDITVYVNAEAIDIVAPDALNNGSHIYVGSRKLCVKERANDICALIARVTGGEIHIV